MCEGGYKQPMTRGKRNDTHGFTPKQLSALSAMGQHIMGSVAQTHDNDAEAIGSNIFPMTANTATRSNERPKIFERMDTKGKRGYVCRLDRAQPIGYRPASG